MNILYINHYAGTVYHGMEYRPYYLAREWVKDGHNVTIVASNFSHLRNKNIIIPSNQNYLNEDIDGIKYVWCRTPKYSGNGIRRVINIYIFLKRLRKLIPELLKQSKPDMVIASSTYPFDAKVAWQISQTAKAKFVYEVHDLWPLTLIELGGMSKYHPFIWLMQKAEDFAYRHADKVVSLLVNAKDYMCEHGMHPNKFVYIPNGVSISDWHNNNIEIPKMHINQLQQIKDSYRFIIGYAGGMGESNALNYLITSAKKLSLYAFVLVGDGVLKSELQKRLHDENITNVFFLPAITKNQIPDFLKRMDALYLGWHNLPIYHFGVCPNKLFDYMLAKKPIIHSITLGNDLVHEANCGVSAFAGDVSAIVMAIDKLAKDNLENRQQLGQNGYNYVQENHDYLYLSRKFINECGVTNV